MFTLFSTESAPSHTKATCRKANGPRVFRIVSDGSQLPDGDLLLRHFPTSYMAVHKEVNPKSRGHLGDNSQQFLVTHSAISVQCLPQNGRIEPERYVSTRLLHLATTLFRPLLPLTHSVIHQHRPPLHCRTPSNTTRSLFTSSALHTKSQDRRGPSSERELTDGERRRGKSENVRAIVFFQTISFAIC